MRGSTNYQRILIGVACCIAASTGCAQFKQGLRSIFVRDSQKNAATTEDSDASAELSASTSPTRKAKPANDPQEGWARPAGATTIGADILMVNNQALSVAEVLFGIREGADHFGTRPYSPPTSVDEAQMIALNNIRQEVGALLLFEKAQKGISEQQKAAIDGAIQKRIDQRVTVEFGGSRSKLEQQLRAYDMNLDDYKTWLKRQMLAREYVRENIAPQADVTREELHAYYQEKTKSSGRPETRELFLIEAPYDAFLPEGQSWKRASAADQQTARLAAEQHIRAANTRLQEGANFTDVARAMDRGPQQERGGAWGKIGRPLRGKYQTPSSRAFQMQEKQTSEPIQTDDGWFIVRCGVIDGPLRKPFADCQQQLREELLEKKFNEYSVEYLKTLSETASISWMNEFVHETIRRLMADQPSSVIAARP
ncbi:MAG: peptidyl-prolyl cis-trans isomerase [Phycisphaerae bacterium]